MSTPKPNGHWVRFVSGIKTEIETFQLRTYLKFGTGFTVADSPTDDSYAISLDLTDLYSSPWKFYVEARSVSNVANLTTVFALGGVSLVSTDRVLLTGQTDQSENGLYVWTSGTGLARAGDGDVDADLRCATVYVRKGDGAGERWYCTNTGTARPDIDNIVFALREQNADKAKLDGIASGAQACSWANIVTAAAGADTAVDLNAQEVTGAADPTAAQSLVTRAYFEANLPASGLVNSVTFDPPLFNIGDSTDPVGSFSPDADVTMNGFGLVECQSVDNSGGTQEYGANTTAQTFGKATTTATFPGDVLVTGSHTVTKSGIGTTKTRGVEVGNETTSGTNVSAQIGQHAFSSGGTRLNIGYQVEVVSSSNVVVSWYHGTGTGAPSSQLFKLNNSDANFGSCAEADAFVGRSGSFVGFRFNNSNNRGGLAQDNSNDALVLKSYNTKDLRFETGADIGGSGGVVRGFWSGAGLGRAVFVPDAPTSSAASLVIDLSKSQNQAHTSTEDTTVTFTGAKTGQSGFLMFLQGATGRTFTFPTDGSGIEYDDTLKAMVLANTLIDTTAGRRTVLTYTVLADVADRIYITGRSISLKP